MIEVNLSTYWSVLVPFSCHFTLDSLNMNHHHTVVPSIYWFPSPLIPLYYWCTTSIPWARMIMISCLYDFSPVFNSHFDCWQTALEPWSMPLVDATSEFRLEMQVIFVHITRLVRAESTTVTLARKWLIRRLKPQSSYMVAVLII